MQKSHGMSGHHLYKRWTAMVQRCHNPRNTGYRNYGGRAEGAIRVCPRWRFGDGDQSGFALWLADMGHPPTRKHQLDRVDGEGHYEPGNVVWQPPKENMRHTRASHEIIWRGRRMTMAEACEIAGLQFATVYCRMRNGETVDQALSRPAARAKVSTRGMKIIVGGVERRATEVARELGIGRATFEQRILTGYTVEEALRPGRMPRRTSEQMKLAA